MVDEHKSKNWKGNLIVPILGLIVIPAIVIILFWLLDIQLAKKNINLFYSINNHRKEITSTSIGLYILFALKTMKLWTMPKPKKKNTLGRQRWSTEEEQRKFFAICPIDINTNLEIGGSPINYLNDNELLYEKDAVHDLTVGVTRSGKSRKIIRQLVIVCSCAKESMIFNDPKKEMYYDFNNFLTQKKNYDSYCLDFRNPEYSDCLNPIDSIIECFGENEQIDDADQYAQDIVTNLVIDDGKGEKIWVDGQKALLKGIILAVAQANCDSKKKNMYSVYQTLALLGGEKLFANRKKMKMILSAFMDSLDETNIARTAYTTVANSPEKTRGGFMTSALATISIFSSIKLAKMLGHSDFKFKDFANGKKALFIVNPDEKKTYDRVASIIYDQSYQILVFEANRLSGRKLKKRVHMIYDEFGNMPQIDKMESKMTVALSRGIIYHLAVQDFAQLDNIYGEKVAKIIRGNCNLWYFISSSDKGTCQEIAEAIGEETIWKDSVSGNYNDNATTTGGGVSYDQISRQLIDANELMTADNRDGKGIIVKRTYFNPSKVYLPDCTKYKWFNEIVTDENEVKRNHDKLYFAVPRWVFICDADQNTVINRGFEDGIKIVDSMKKTTFRTFEENGILPPENNLYWYWAGRNDLHDVVYRNVLKYVSTQKRILNRKEIDNYLNSKEFLKFINSVDNDNYNNSNNYSDETDTIKDISKLQVSKTDKSIKKSLTDLINDLEYHKKEREKEVWQK